MTARDDVSVASELVGYYEAKLEEHGDSHLGVAWPRASDAQTRYRIMLDVVRDRSGRSADESGETTLLDFGCGAGHLLEYLLRSSAGSIAYTGADQSERFVRLCRSKHRRYPFLQLDVLRDGITLPTFDYVVMNGVLTVKGSVEQGAMWAYAQRLLSRCFSMANVGLAFNVMTKHLDWERDDLFHVGFDDMAAFVRRDLSRNFVFRQDYGLYEYTTYVYRDAS